MVAEEICEKGDPSDTLSKRDLTLGCIGEKLHTEIQVRAEKCKKGFFSIQIQLPFMKSHI